MGRLKTSVLVIGFSALVFVLGAAYLLLQKRMMTPVANEATPTRSTASLMASSTNTPAPSSEKESPRNLPSAGGIPSNATPHEPSQFVKWLKIESQSLNQVGVNTAQKEIQMKILARTMDTTQKGELVQSALNTANSANERILATYLLSLGSGKDSETHILAVAEAPLPELGPTGPHSAGEVRRVQELSLRYIMVDELAKRASKDSQAREQLQTISQSAAAPEVRNYARRKLSEIGSL